MTDLRALTPGTVEFQIREACIAQGVSDIETIVAVATDIALAHGDERYALGKADGEGPAYDLGWSDGYGRGLEDAKGEDEN